MSRLSAALADLLRRVRDGEEFPDACGRCATRHRVSYDSLRDAYDEHCAT